jgi:hypothetical protein
MKRLSLLFLFVVLLAGCDLPIEEDLISVEVVKVRLIFPPSGWVSNTSGAWVVVTRDHEVIAISMDMANKMAITPAWYALSIRRFENGAMQGVMVSGPIEPVQIKQKRIIESEEER